MAFRRQEKAQPLTINRTSVERVPVPRASVFTSTTEHTSWRVKKAQRHPLYLTQLRRFGVNPTYTCTVQSILSASITSITSC